MKKKFLLFILGGYAISLCGCNPSSPEVVHTVKKVNYCDIDLGTTIEKNIDFFSDNPYVCYIPIEQYKNYFSSYTMSVKRNKNIYTFNSFVNNSKAYLNADTGELSYDSFSLFTSYNSIPHVEIVINALPFEIDENESSYVEGKTKFKINLSDYNLKPKKDGDNYYLPLDVLMLIDPLSPKGTAYFDGDNTVTILYNTASIKDYQGKVVVNYPKTFYEYTYDTFSFNVDLVYGLNGYSRPLRSDNYRRYTFNEKGAKNWNSKYKEAISNATTSEQFDTALDKVFEELPDGGHSIIERVSIATDPNKLDPSFGIHDEDHYTTTRLTEEVNARSNAGDEQQLKYVISKFDTDKDGNDDIGYFTIDEFTTLGTEAMQSVLVYANNAFNKNNKQGEEGSKYIKDVVIDLGYNRGGSTGCEGMLLSWICGGKAKQILKDGRDDSVTTTVVKYDLNKDGKYDEGDCLPNDVNIYILSDATFSAGATLVFDTYMYTLSDEYKTSNKNITFIGQPHLGGSCSITNTVVMPTGFSYHMSSNSVGINWYNPQLTCDEIINISPEWTMTVEQITNRTGYINPKIVNERNK